MVENTRLEAVLSYSSRWTKNEAYRHLAEVGPDMVNEVRELRLRARHHRKEDPVLVGAIAVVLATDGRLGKFTGANQNLAEGQNPTKICAEFVSMYKPIAVAAGSEFADGELLMLMSSGTVQPDTHSKRKFPTLHPCGLDRDLMRGLRMVKPHSVMVTVHPWDNRAEVQRFDELLERHEGAHDLASPHYVDSTKEVWQEGAGLLHLADSGMLGPLPLEFDEPAVRFRAAVTGHLGHVLERQGVIIPPVPETLKLFL